MLITHYLEIESQNFSHFLIQVQQENLFQEKSWKVNFQKSRKKTRYLHGSVFVPLYSSRYFP